MLDGTQPGGDLAGGVHFDVMTLAVLETERVAAVTLGAGDSEASRGIQPT